MIKVWRRPIVCQVELEMHYNPVVMRLKQILARAKSVN